MKTKKFIRLVCNTSSHPRGEKIKALNVITKIYDDDDNFIEVKKPYIKEMENQIEIDIEGYYYHVYLPLHHFKVDKGKIVKKTASEISTIDATIAQAKQQKLIDNQKAEQDKQDNEIILKDKTKSDKERLNAMSKLIF